MPLDVKVKLCIASQCTVAGVLCEFDILKLHYLHFGGCHVVVYLDPIVIISEVVMLEFIKIGTEIYWMVFITEVNIKKVLK